MNNDLRYKAAAILGSDKLQILEDAGITIIPMVIMNRLQDCLQEEILIIPGRTVLIAPATESDIERVAHGYIVMD